MLFGDGPKGNKFASAAIGENNFDSAFHFGTSLVKTIKVGEFGNVALNAGTVAADCLHGLVEFLLAAARNEDISTLIDEKLCPTYPNPFCPAGDDGGLALEFFGHSFSPLLLSSELATPDPALSITCFRAPLGRGDRRDGSCGSVGWRSEPSRSEEHTSELQSRLHLVCRP